MDAKLGRTVRLAAVACLRWGYQKISRSARLRWQLAQWLAIIQTWDAPEQLVQFQRFAVAPDIIAPAGQTIAEHRTDLFRGDISAALGKGVVINRELDDMVGRVVLVGSEYETARSHRLKIGAGALNAVDIRDFETNEMTVANPLAVISFKNCRIRSLVLFAECRNVSIEDCMIGLLHIERGPTGPASPREISIGVLNVTRSFIRGLRLRTTESLQGNVRIVRTVFDRHPQTDRSDGERAGLEEPYPQDYRNARINLQARGNQQAAGVFHAIEQSLERRSYPVGISRFLSWGYEVMADFGNSIARPIAWFFGLTVTGMGVEYATNDAVPEQVVAATNGWRGALASPGPAWRLMRSAVLELRYVRDPLAFLSPRGLVASGSVWISSFLVWQSLLSLTALALLIIAVRRRFKLS